MKNLSLITFIFLLVSRMESYAQSYPTVSMMAISAPAPINRFTSPELKSKGKKLKKVGLILAGSGIVAIAGGALLVADAGVFSVNYFKEKKWKETTPERIIERYAGGVLMDLGTYAVAGGVVCYIIGNKKAKREKAALNFTFTPVSAGIGLSF